MLLHLLLTWFILLMQYNNKSISVFSQLLNPDDPLTLKEVTSIPGVIDHFMLVVFIMIGVLNQRLNK